MSRWTLACIATLGLACDVVPLDEEPSDDGLPFDVQRAFDASCAVSGCHAGSVPAGGLSLEAGQSQNAIGGSSSNSSLPLIELGNIEGSYLALKMLPPELRPASAGLVSGDQMPVGGGDAIANAIIMAWLAGGDVTGAWEGCLGPSEPLELVEFAPHVFPILEGSCIFGGCHDAGSPTMLALSPGDPEGARTSLVDVMSSAGIPYVDPGDPKLSYLWRKLSGTHLELEEGAGTAMPVGEALCIDDILLINRWIVQGAN